MNIRKSLEIFIFFFILFGCQCSIKTTAPEDLIGVWKTSAPQYEDRFFEMKKDEIIFGTGPGTFDSHVINKVEMGKVRGEEGKLYTIYYKNQEGVEDKFSFYYNPGKGGAIRFKNQEKIVWTKEKG
jgi:hypothetical protein